MNAKALVALGGMYHWTAMTLLRHGMAAGWFVRERQHTGSFWGDFKQLCQPLVFYAMLGIRCSVWGWNHVVASESTALRKALRLAQIEEHTVTEEPTNLPFQEPRSGRKHPPLPDRETYREQGQSPSVDWMLSGGVTLVLALDLPLCVSHVGVGGHGAVASHLGLAVVVLMYLRRA